MRSAYKILAHSIAGLVAFQAAVMVFAIAGLYNWVSDGNQLTESHLQPESDLEFTGVIGFMLHGMVGTMLIPLVALILLIVSFFAKIPGGVKWAAIVLGLVVLQVFLGIFGHETAYSGLLHGLNALVLFSAALGAGRIAATTTAGVASPYEDSAVR
jgi:hypothetical protein